MTSCSCSRAAVGPLPLYASSVPSIGGAYPGRYASTATTASALALAGSGYGVGYGYGGPRNPAATLAAAGPLGAGAVAAPYVQGVPVAPTPPVQVQLFESASYTCEPTFSVIPYGFGPAVSVMTPTQVPAPSMAQWNAYGQYGVRHAPILAALGQDDGPVVIGGGEGNDDDVVIQEPAGEDVVDIGPAYTPGFTPAPEFTANACGCCRTPFSVLPPGTFEAWRPLIERINAPYSGILSCNNGWGCGSGGF